MPQFAHFDHTVADPKPVIGWFDTDLLDYPNLPAAADLLQVTAAQWAARMANPSGWVVSGGALAQAAPVTLSNPVQIPALAFLNRFTAAEETAIAAAALTNASILIWLTKAGAAQMINLTDATTKAGLDALVAAGLLTADRAAAILTP